MSRASTADNQLVHAHTTRRLATDPSDELLFYRRDRPVRRPQQAVLWAAQPVDNPCTVPAKLPVAPVAKRAHVARWIMVFVVAGVVGGALATRDFEFWSADPTAST